MMHVIDIDCPYTIDCTSTLVHAKNLAASLNQQVNVHFYGNRMPPEEEDVRNRPVRMRITHTIIPDNGIATITDIKITNAESPAPRGY